MSKSFLKYYQFMDKINADVLFTGLVGYGLFSEKLPPIFTSLSWLNFYNKNTTRNYWKKPTQYVFYESMRNTNVPRMMGIPNPISYTVLCQCLKEYWSDIRAYFKEQTEGQPYKKSRIHIRLKKNDKTLFHMNYGNPAADGEPEIDLLFNSYYVVKADISQCFPSMYSHAIAWALVGKKKAKEDKEKDDVWYNCLDRLARNVKDGETNGFLIGPHSSNLLSEIILCAVDSKLQKWRYFRNIDDYTCYVKDQQEAENFLVDLCMQLKEFGLSLNHKKTKIIKLPMGQDESWTRKLKNNIVLYSASPIKYPQIHAFMEFIIDLVKETENSAIINYAMKIIAKRNLTENARQYYIQIIIHLSLIYTYLFPFLDDYLFIPFDVQGKTIQALSELMYENGCKSRNAESISYALFFAIKYQFSIQKFDCREILEISDCVLNAIAWQYAKANKLPLNDFYSKALELNTNDDDFNRNWLFVYEVLEQAKLKDTWAAMKHQGVSFIIPLNEIFAKVSPDYELIDFDYQLSCDYEEFNNFFTELWSEYIASDSTNEIDIYQHYLKKIILNLRLAFVLRKNVKIPKSSSYYDDTFHKNGPKICIVMNHLVSWLKENCYIGERLGDPSYGYTSYWGKPKLYSRFAEIPTAQITRLSSYLSSVVLKDSKKQIIDIPFSEKAHLYETRLNEINTFYKEQKFTYHPYLQEDELLYPRLTAIFNDSSWDLGGRLYSSFDRGINYQSIPSDLRKFIFINNQETVEIDYSGLHISMLYAQKGHTPPKDPYSFLSGEERQLAKFATLVMINSSSEKGIVATLEKRRDELHNKQGLSPKKRALKRALDTYSDFSSIIELIKENHATISDSFFSGAGIKLQNIDSAMALEIVYYFYQNGIPVLPMHDSFIIEKKYSPMLKSKMKDVFSKYNNGFACSLK